jgi:hypothetical protein
MPNPTVAQEKSNVSPLLGALFGAGLGYKASMAQGAGNSNQTNNLPVKNPVTNPVIPKIPTGTTGTSGGTSTGGGSTGTVGGITFPAGTTQAQIDAQYGKTNGQSNYVIAGSNMSNGSIIAQPNTMIPGYTSTGTGAGPSDTATPPADQTAGTYFQDNYGNIYDPSGNLYAVNSGGTYYVDSGNGMWTDVSTGDQVSTNDLYSYTGGGYDPNATPTDITGGGGYADGSIFDNSPIDTGTVVKDGGLITMMKRGGGVKHFVGGGPTDATVDNTAPPPATDSTSIIDSILGFAKNNPMLSGAALGGLLTQLINSNSSYSVNKGVDMSALGSLKPRTTPAGPAKFVPYSQYGTPTSPADYSTLYNNLGVSPFSTAPTAPTTPGGATSTMPAISTPTTPTGGLPTTPTSPVVTTPTTATPTYYSDADGNIYDANGDLVYDTTSSSVVTPTASVTPSTATSVAPSSGLAVSSLPTTTAADASYSYGTAVTPASVLGSKKGGLAVKKMADGGTTGMDYPTQKNTLFDLQSGWTTDDLISAIKTLYPNATQEMIDQVLGIGAGYAGNPMSLKNTIYQDGGIGFSFDPTANPTPKPTPTPEPIPMPTPTEDTSSLDTFYNSMSSIDPLQYDNYFAPEANYNLGNYGDITGQQIQDYFTMRNNEMPVYNQGMPTQGPAMPIQGPAMPPQGGLMPPQGPAMPTQGSAMPTQGPAMPQQPSFSSSPTFKYSGANNPLLTGLRQGPVQQPYMLMPDGTFAPREEISTSRTYAEGGVTGYDNLNIPHEVGGLPTPQEMTGQDVPMINGRKDYRNGNYVEGPGDGQSDDIPAMLADGEYVIDAETVAQLGNGSNKAGAKILDGFRKNIRAHKRSAPHDKIPPKSKSPLAYLKGAK